MKILALYDGTLHAKTALKYGMEKRGKKADSFSSCMCFKALCLLITAEGRQPNRLRARRPQVIF